MLPYAVLVAVLSSHAAFAGGLRLVADLPDLKHDSLMRATSNRFVRLGVQWEHSERGKPGVAHYQLLDLQEHRVVDVAVPFNQLPSSYAQILGRTDPSSELVHSDGQVTTFTFTSKRGYEPLEEHLGQYDHRTKSWSELVPLAPWNDTQHYESIGFDPTDTYLYFATAANPAGDVIKRGYTSLELARIHLKTRVIDWRMHVDLPKRDKPIKLVSGPKVFSPDGRKLALVEYNDVGNERDHPARPQQQVLVVDIPSKQVDAYPVPLTAYGTLFTRDDRYLIIGSNETGEIIRIDLEKKVIDTKVKGQRKIHTFLPTPSGTEFLVIANTKLASPKAVEVRSVADLRKVTSIPMRMLYPGNDGVFPNAMSGLGGRALLCLYVDAKGWGTDTGVRLYELPDVVDSPVVSGSAGGDLKAAQAAILGKQYADAHGIEYRDVTAAPSATFGQFVAAKGGDVFLVGTLSENSDYDYKVGRTKPIVVRLDARGQARWRRVLTAKGFLDYEGGSLAPTADGGCIVWIASYVHPARHPVTRIVKLDANGKTLWEHRFRGNGGAKTALGDNFELLPDGSVSITGRYYEDREDKIRHEWKAVLDTKGKVVVDTMR